jgi:major membrane immunogen (membrane-anchored lipoprotein)
VLVSNSLTIITLCVISVLLTIIASAASGGTGQRTNDKGHMPMHEELFPHVSFNDKVAIHFKDGSIVELKHLYHDDSELNEICWANVTDCHEI